MILTQLPDLLPRPETAANAAFRRHFYSRWGKENCIVAGSARRAEYAPYRQTLSIKAVQHGHEHYYVDHRRLTVTGGTYLVLNEGREYSSMLDSAQQAFSFALFFRPGLAGEVAQAGRQSLAAAMDSGEEPEPAAVEFSEMLRRNDSSVTPVLRYLQYYVRRGVDDQAWYDEQFYFLLERLLRNERQLIHLSERLDCVSTAKRRELAKRLASAVEYMHDNLHEELSLTDLAAAAHLSAFHFLRLFRALYGETPVRYLRRQRTHRAVTLIETTSLDITEIAAEVGLSRLALWRSLRAMHGAGPQRIRQRCNARHKTRNY